MSDLSKKIGDVEFDGLVIDNNPAARFTGVKVAALEAEATLKRGTVLAKGADGKCVILGTEGEAGTFSATGDGTTTKFSLLDDGVIPDAVTEVKVDGTATDEYFYNPATGDLIFDSAPANTKAIAVKTLTGKFEPYAILADDTVVGTSDVVAIAYVAGCFDGGKLIVAEGYTITEGDKDALRKYDIVIKESLA